MHLRPILHADQSRSRLLQWKRVMIPEQTMEACFLNIIQMLCLYHWPRCIKTCAVHLYRRD